MIKLYPIIFTYLTLMCFGFIDNGRGPAYPFFLNEFKITTASGSLIFTLSSIFALFTNYTSKVWLTKLTPRHALQTSLLLQAIGTLLFAIPIHFKLPFYFVLIGSVIFGMGAGASNVCNNIIIARSTGPKNRRKVFSGLHSVYAIASLLSPLLFNYFYELTGFWPLYFYILSAIPFIISVSLIFIHFNLNGEEDIKKMIKVSVPFKLRASIGTMLALNVMAEVIISSRLVLYIQRFLGETQYQASVSLSFFFLSLLLGRLSSALFHLPGKPLHLLFGSSSLALLLVLLGLHYHPLFLSLVGLPMSIFFPTAMDWISKKFSEESDYMIASSLNYVGSGLIIMHVLFGNIVNTKGIQVAMHLSPLVLLISLFFVMRFILDEDFNS